jgi:H/ACA ribonucleoprotein complex subunit 3
MILKCPSCGTYTLKRECPKCSCETSVPKPMKFSPEDRLGKYRRQAKLSIRKEMSLI